MRTFHCQLLTLVLISVLSQSVRGQTATAPSAPPDTSQRVPDPRTALLLGLIPGGGQIYNRAWIKALLVIAAEGYSIYQFQHYRKLYNDNSDPADAGNNPYLELRNRHAWRALFIYLIGMMDAYVDAHLSTFPPDTTYQVTPPTTPAEEESP